MEALCSAHFEETCFEADVLRHSMWQNPMKLRRVLKLGAVPTTFISHWPERWTFPSIVCILNLPYGTLNLLF